MVSAQSTAVVSLSVAWTLCSASTLLAASVMRPAASVEIASGMPLVRVTRDG
jgi:hypothetical protein